jgi:hypothetical protein
MAALKVMNIPHRTPSGTAITLARTKPVNTVFRLVKI